MKRGTVIDMERNTHLFQPSGQINKAKGNFEFLANEKKEEVILLSSDSEKVTKKCGNSEFQKRVANTSRKQEWM